MSESSRNAAVAFETESRDGLHVEDAKRVDDQWRAAGESGMTPVVTGTGETMGRRANSATGASTTSCCRT